MNDCVLSVVMPTFNQAGFIAESVRSVLGQGQPGVELVVMDGGSTDGTQAILAGLAAEYPGCLRWASHPDHGPADAVNAAVRAARAPLIGWLNSDDLYAAGALQRAVAHFASHPDDVMVYGEGDHVDVLGAFMERYPTLPPSTPYGYFADGCFICQPTAFFRRDAFLDLGGLDLKLKAAFDFELWLRLFRRYPGRIGFIPEVLAKSRLHAGGITLKFRERVALEGLEVIHRHLGVAPGHWLLTHLNELCDMQPFLPDRLDLGARFDLLLERASPWLASAVRHDLHRQAHADRRVVLSHPDVHVGIHADGWASDALTVRVQQTSEPIRDVVLHCRHHAPRAGLIEIRTFAPQGELDVVRVDGNGPFDLVLPCLDMLPGARLVFQLQTAHAFVPAEVSPPSADRRALAFLVDEVSLRR